MRLTQLANDILLLSQQTETHCTPEGLLGTLDDLREALRRFDDEVVKLMTDVGRNAR